MGPHSVVYVCLLEQLSSDQAPHVSFRWSWAEFQVFLSFVPGGGVLLGFPLRVHVHLHSIHFGAQLQYDGAFG